MTRILLPAMALALAVGCNSTVNGKVVDGLTGQPIMGKPADAGEEVQPNRLVAAAVKKGEDGSLQQNAEAGLTCMTFSSPIGQDGSISLSGLCTGSTAYQLSIEPDKNYFLGETNMFDQGMKADAPITIKVWRAPNGTAVNILRKDGTTLDPVRSRQKVKSEKITDSEEMVHYPEGIKGVPMMEAGEYLVLSGAANADLTLYPLVNSDERMFKTEETEVKMQPWSYIGTRFTDDTTFERVGASMDAGKVVTVEKDGHIVKFIPTEALGEKGRYALWKDGSETAYLIDIGAKGEMPGAAATEGGENAGGENGGE